MNKENIVVAIFVILILGALVFVTVRFNRGEQELSTTKESISTTSAMKKLSKPSMEIDAKKSILQR